MSISTHVIGFRPADDTWMKMKAVWDACEAAGVDPPNEVSKFFEFEAPDDHGVEVDLSGAATQYHVKNRDGFEVDVRKLPPNVHIIRFYNSW
jgi:hypothetical protein